MVLGDAGFAEYFVLPVDALACAVHFGYAAVGSGVEVGVTDASAEYVGEVVEVAAECLEFILVAHVVFHSEEVELLAETAEADVAVVAYFAFA